MDVSLFICIRYLHSLVHLVYPACAGAVVHAVDMSRESSTCATHVSKRVPDTNRRQEQSNSKLTH